MGSSRVSCRGGVGIGEGTGEGLCVVSGDDVAEEEESFPV